MFKSQPGGAYNQVFNFGSPRPKEEVLKDFEPKQVDSLLLTVYAVSYIRNN